MALTAGGVISSGVAPVRSRPVAPLSAAPAMARERTVTQKALRSYLGEMRHGDWKRLLASAGVAGGRREALSARECEAVMRKWYQRVGEFRMRRWRAT